MRVFHSTTKDRAELIRLSRKLVSAGEPDVYVSSIPNGDYGDGTVVELDIPKSRLMLDDEFPDGRQDYRLPCGSGGSVSVQVVRVIQRAQWLTEQQRKHPAPNKRQLQQGKSR